MKKILLPLIALAILLLQGCVQVTAPKAYATPVTVTQKENKAGLLDLGSKHIRYVVKDQSGRTSAVMSASPTFNVGDCVTLWRSPSSNHASYQYYPRLAPADKGCRALTPEPEADKYYRYKFTVSDSDKGYQRYSYKLDTWLDSPVADLIQSWGAPNGFYKDNDGTEFITYKKGHTTTTTSYNGYGQALDSSSANYWCNTTYTIKKGYIFDYSWEGNNCR